MLESNEKMKRPAARRRGIKTRSPECLWAALLYNAKWIQFLLSQGG